MNYFQAKVEYTKQVPGPGGMSVLKKVKEVYIVLAISPTDCEARLNKELALFSHDGIIVATVNKCKLEDVLAPEMNKEHWYKCVYELVTLSDDKEVKQKVTFMVFADTLKEATSLLEKDVAEYGGEVVKVERTNIVDVLRTLEN